MKLSIVLLIALFSSQQSIAQDKASLKNTLFSRVANESGLDPLLLYSIALTESAISEGKGLIRPHPYVIRSSEGPRYFNNKEKAEQELIELLKTNQNIDVGMMQINLKFHPQANPALLFDAEHNLKIAAEILLQALSTTKDPIIGVGRYHSSTPRRALWYGKRVWQTYQNLTEIIDH